MNGKFPLVGIGVLEDKGAITEIQDGNHGERHPKAADYVEDGIPFIMANDLSNGFVALDSCSRISEDQARCLRIGFAISGDVLLTHKGTLGNVALVTEADPFIMLTPQVTYYRTDSSHLLNRFLVYAFREPGFQARMHAVGAQGTRPYVGITAQRRLQIVFPSNDIQGRIADMLSAYDDLIDNNRRRMALLEEAARQLYREWFVRLRFPGHEHTRITNGVPEGWERRRIGDVADCVGGGTPSTSVSSYWEDGDVTWVTPTDATRNRHFVLLDSEKKITEAGLQNSSAKLVPPHAVLMTSRASVGFFAVAGREVCTNQGFISIVPTDATLWPYFLFHLSERVEEIRVMASGSTYPEVSRGKFRGLEVLLPKHSLTLAFGEYATEVLKQVRVLKQQDEKLRAARDLLLPRLMAGKMPV